MSSALFRSDRCGGRPRSRCSARCGSLNLVPLMRRYSIAMVAACPFPANHGTPAAIREMSEELARRGHTVRVVTYPLSEQIPIEGVAIDRVRQIGFNRTITVGPSYQRLIYDFLLIFKLLKVVREYRIEIIHAHNYEAA